MESKFSEFTAAETIGNTITSRILGGAYPPGSHLAPVRELAAEFNVTPPTIQRVIARLEAKGLVTAHHGSGVIVHNPLVDVGFELLPDWLEVLAEQPQQAADLVAGVLEIRRTLTLKLVERHLQQIVAEAPRIVEIINELLQVQTLEEIAKIDFKIAETVVKATGELAYILLFNAIRLVTFRTPFILLAMYGDVDFSIASLQGFITAISSSEPLPVRLGKIGNLLEEADKRTVKRYRELLERAQKYPTS